jgi:anhydro-N-acetylmuramic acid kinase
MGKLSGSSRTKSFFKFINISGNHVRVIGLNSGTSCDGLDAALIEFIPGESPSFALTKTYGYPKKIREALLFAGDPDLRDGEHWMKIDAELGNLMGKFTADFNSGLSARGLKPHFIASHGHTIRHLPRKNKDSTTLQIGNASQLAVLTGLPVISDFRQSDIAAGGQGAPLSPVLHQELFRDSTRYRAVVNIGGIANITVLPPIKSRKMPFASDCGPGNMVIDGGMKFIYGRKYDRKGEIASRGNPDIKTVNQVARLVFFKVPPPKSTGREQFGNRFLVRLMSNLKGLPPEDIIATISEITAISISGFINRFAPEVEEIFLCGGGSKNRYIVSRLKDLLPGVEVLSTSDLGYNPDYIESMLWAYLGYCFVRGIRIESSRFTGARNTYIPGKLCLP